MINLNIAPKRPKNFTITLDKMLYSLIVFLAIFAAYKTYANGRLARDMISTQATVALSQMQDLEPGVLNTVFTKQPFCGWKLEKQGADTLSSEKFDETSADGNLFEKEFSKDNIDQRFSICFNGLDSIKSSVNRQLLFILIITCGIIFLINQRDNIKDESAEKVSGS